MPSSAFWITYTVLRPVICCRPVTLPLLGGITTPPVFVLKMDKQPRTSPPTILMLVQPYEPMKSCPFWLICMRPWYPSVMMAEPVTVIELVAMAVSLPQVVALVMLPAQVFVPGGVPATYRVEPLTKPKVAALTGVVLVAVDAPTSAMLTPAAVPPHCAPQFKM